MPVPWILWVLLVDLVYSTNDDFQTDWFGTKWLNDLGGMTNQMFMTLLDLYPIGSMYGIPTFPYKS